MSESVLGRPATSRFAIGSAAAVVVYFGGVGITFLSQLLIARILGANSFGIYAYVFAWMSVLAYGAALGFQVALLRFIPSYETQQDWSLLKGVVQYADRRVGLVSLAVVLVGAGIVLIRGETLSPQLRDTFLIGFLLVPAWAFLWIRSAAVRAYGGVVLALAPERIMRDGLLLVAVVFVSYVLHHALDAREVMTTMVISSVLGLCLACWAKSRLQPDSVTRAAPDHDASAWRNAALPLLVAGAMDTLFNRTGILMLGWLGETRNAGIYGIAFSVAFLVVLPRTAIDTLFAPAISRLYTQRRLDELQRLMVRAASWSLCAAAGIAIVLAVMAEYLLSWFGPDYVAGADVLRILLVGQVLSASAGSQTFVLAMTGHERNSAMILTVCAGINGVVSFLLIYLFGITGAAWGTTVSLIIWQSTMAAFVWHKLNLWPGVYGHFRPSQ